MFLSLHNVIMQTIIKLDDSPPDKPLVLRAFKAPGQIVVSGIVN